MSEDKQVQVYKHKTIDLPLSHDSFAALNRRQEPNGPLARLFRWFRRVLWD